MGDTLKDPRFSHVTRDPKFRRIPKSERKVKIDSRFKSMFKDKNFAVKYTVDKHGRPTTQSSKENLQKFYDLSSDEESEEETTLKPRKKSRKNKESKMPADTRKEKSGKKKIEGKKMSEKKNLKTLGKSRMSAKDKKNVDEDESEEEAKVSLVRLKKSEDVEDEEESDIIEEEEGSEENVEEEDSEEIEDEEDSEENEEAGESEENPEDEELEEDEEDDKSSKKNKKQLKLRKKDEIKVVPGDVKKKLRNLKIDYARGEDVLFSDSSSSEEEEDFEEDDEENEIIHDWGEMDKNAETTEEATHRLAVCNMDWDRIRAVDLMVLLSSFLPEGRLIRSVSIYPSEFGLERMKEEELRGPKELVELKDEDIENKNEDSGDEELGSSFQREKMRQYQINRLKYFYAVVVCDSAESADKIYTECDGTEFETTGTKVDLRFIPDDTTFDEKPRDSCNELPTSKDYKPRNFTTTALQQVKVDLTWDETDPNRIDVFLKLNSGKYEDIGRDELRNYLASESSEEELDEEEPSPEDKDNAKTKKISTIEKYKALIESIENEEEEKKKNKEMEYEMTWDLNEKEKVEKIVKETTDQSDDVNPFQKYLEKKKEKKKAKREEKKKLKKKENDSDSEDSIPSDIDMNDPYFAEERQGMKTATKKRKVSDSEENNSEDERNQAELQLLLTDREQNNKKHFNMKKIEELESMSKSKKKRLEKEHKKVKTEDNFQVDVEDPRFGAIYTSHLFNIDPSDPNYRKTKGTEALIAEKLKKRSEEDNSLVQETGDASATKSRKKTELSQLVKSVKQKSSLKRK